MRTRSQTKSQLSGSDEDTDFNNICDTLKLLRQQAEALIAAENATNDEDINSAEQPAVLPPFVDSSPEPGTQTQYKICNAGQQYSDFAEDNGSNHETVHSSRGSYVSGDADTNEALDMESPSAKKRKREQILAKVSKRCKIDNMPLDNPSPNDQIVPIIEAEAANISALEFLGLETVSDIFPDSTPPNIDLSAEKTSTDSDATVTPPLEDLSPASLQRRGVLTNEIFMAEVPDTINMDAEESPASLDEQNVALDEEESVELNPAEIEEDINSIQQLVNEVEDFIATKNADPGEIEPDVEEDINSIQQLVNEVEDFIATKNAEPGEIEPQLRDASASVNIVPHQNQDSQADFKMEQIVSVTSRQRPAISSGKRITILDDIQVCPPQKATADADIDETVTLSSVEVGVKIKISKRSKVPKVSKIKTVLEEVSTDRERQSSDQDSHADFIEQIAIRNEVVHFDFANQPIIKLRKLPQQPKRPTMIKVAGVTTRASNNNYDDSDKTQNELIGMEINAAMLPGRPMPKQQKFKLFQKQCEVAKLPPPLPLPTFETMNWSHVSTFDHRELASGHEFLTPDELLLIPRRHGKFPYCHPGPVVDTVSGTGDWYYADSIVQQVKLINRKEFHYIVRWVGYEDAYNTVEPERNLLGTAVLLLHKLQRYATASRSIGPVLLRRSCRQINAVPVPISSKEPESVQNEKFLKTMKRLDEHLDQEKLADRYYHEIGFVARGDGDADGKVVQSLKHQFDFIERVFFPIVDEMGSQGFHMSTKFLGTIFGKNRSKTLQTVEVTTIDKHESISRYISAGLKAAGTTNDATQYVSFFVLTKHGSNETADEKHMDMHVCVYTVRASNEGKDCVYYDPAAESHGHYIPKCIRDLRKPVLRSSTRLYGAPSQREDCLYQCFKYVIGLHSGQINFEPNVNQKYFPRI